MLYPVNNQDYPSMASPTNAVVVWIAVNECNDKTHSIVVTTQKHVQGLLAGEQTDKGYILDDQVFEMLKFQFIIAHIQCIVEVKFL